MKKLIILQSLFTLFFSLFFVESAYAQSLLATGREDVTYGSYRYEEDENDIPPVPVLRIRNNSGNNDQLSGTTATIFTFDGNGSKDAETSPYLLETRFDFDNDGKLDTYFSKTKMQRHTYETSGPKTVRMDVLDRAGNVSSSYENIYIAENTPPEAFFTVEPKVGTPGTVFTFDTGLSSDHQYSKNLLQYRFDFNSDGIFDTKFKKIRNWKHEYKISGLKKIKLEVRDPEGASAFYEQYVYVKENTPPIASFTIKPQKGDKDKAVIELDASNSYDKESTKLKYRWDFNFTGKNDIQFDTTWNSYTRSFAYFYKSGEYVIKLLVKDDDGALSTAFIKFYVYLLNA